MKKTIVIFSSLAIAAALFTGCQTVPEDTGAYIPLNTMVNDLENHEDVVLLNRNVQNSVTCSGLQLRPREDGRLDVTGNIRNRENRRIEVQINCVVKDDQGVAVEGESPFHTLILSENGQESVHFVSMNNKAKRFTIRIREAH